ncbi:MAG: hypothetical protein CMJ18_07175 [Phycisphaeraceae bacterium]|nr:hypothetical protein [Phycisphaeraceae bacterium]
MKHFWLVARIVVAAGGIGYIVWSLQWTDKVAVPADPRVATQFHDRAFAVRSGDETTFRTGGAVTIDLEGEPWAVPAEPWRDPDGRVFERAAEDAQGDGDGPDLRYRFRPGVVTTLKGASVGWLITGLVVLAPIFPLLAARWWLLLRARGLHVGFGKSMKLLLVGNFFNYCMPGTTGGDVIKAYYAASGSDRKADAAMSVVVDRVVGTLGLILVGGAAGLTMWENEVARRITASIWLLAAVLVVGGFVYLSPAVRSALRLEKILAKLPAGGLLSSIDQAVVAYRDHKATIVAAVGLAVLIQCCNISSAVIGGYALGIEHPVRLVATVVPVLLFGAAIPISYQGLGIQEAIGMPLLVQPPLCTANQMIGMLMLYRVYMIAYSLTGSYFVFRGDVRMHPERQEQDSAPSDAAGDEQTRPSEPPMT